MKVLVTILGLLTISSTVFATNEQVITHKKVCAKVDVANFENCYSVTYDDAGTPVFEFEIIAANSKLEIRSSESYEGIDSSELTAGLQKIGSEGMDAHMVTFIAGPVVHAMETAKRNPNPDSLLKLEEVKLRLAKRVSN